MSQGRSLAGGTRLIPGALSTPQQPFGPLGSLSAKRKQYGQPHRAWRPPPVFKWSGLRAAADGDSIISQSETGQETSLAAAAEAANSSPDAQPAELERQQSGEQATTSGQTHAAPSNLAQACRQAWGAIAREFASLLAVVTAMFAWIPAVKQRLHLKRLRTALTQSPSDPERCEDFPLASLLYCHSMSNWEGRVIYSSCTLGQIHVNKYSLELKYTRGLHD